MGKQWKQWQALLWGPPKSLQMVTAAKKLNDACSLEEELWPTRQHIEKQRHYFANKGPSSRSHGFSSSHVWMWELDHKESWAPKNWTVVLEETLESPLDFKEIQPAHPKEDQSWIFVRRTDAEAATAILWPLDVKNALTGKDPDAGEDWRREEKGMTRMRWLDGITDSMDMEFEWTPGVGRGDLACCRPWGPKESDTTELNWTEQVLEVIQSRSGEDKYNSYKITYCFSRARLCDHMDCSTPGLPVPHSLPGLLKLMFIESVMPSSYLIILCHRFSSCLQSFPASGSLPMSQLFVSGGQRIEASASASVFPMNIQGWFYLGWTRLISSQSKGLSQKSFLYHLYVESKKRKSTYL